MPRLKQPSAPKGPPPADTPPPQRAIMPDPYSYDVRPCTKGEAWRTIWETAPDGTERVWAILTNAQLAGLHRATARPRAPRNTSGH